MQTTYGRTLLEPHFDKHSISFEDMRETFMFLLAWDKFLLHFNESVHVDMAYNFSATLVLLDE
jgi:hypothetical protein